MTDHPTVVPHLTYADASAAMTFLQAAFDFVPVQSFSDEAGQLVHGEMRFGNGVIMVGTGAPSMGSVGIYVVVAEIDAHLARAEAAGAVIVEALHDTEFGTRRYRARDPEGYVWSFGTYAPQTSPPVWAS